ncbi:MAG: hypothetical protein ABJB74_13935 [Gemmatimonas sp.]
MLPSRWAAARQAHVANLIDDHDLSEKDYRMFTVHQCCHALVVTALALGLPTSSARTVVVGAKLPVATEVQAIVTGLRKIAIEERIELNIDQICRVDVTHPDCPKNLKVSSFKGHLPGAVWAKAEAILNADPQMGKQGRSVFKATVVYVQRPVAVGDSIVMLVQMIRPVEKAPRQKLWFDVVLRGDSTHMEVVRSAQRTDQPVK